MSVARLLSQYCEQTGKSTRDIAEWFQVSRGVIGRWLAGEIQPRLDQAVILSRQIGCTLNELAGLMATGDHLSDVERVVLDAYRRSGLPADEAIRALHDHARRLGANGVPAGDMARTTVQAQDDKQPAQQAAYRKAN